MSYIKQLQQENSRLIKALERSEQRNKKLRQGLHSLKEYVLSTKFFPFAYHLGPFTIINKLDRNIIGYVNCKDIAKRIEDIVFD